MDMDMVPHSLHVFFIQHSARTHAHLEDCNLAAEVAHAIDCDRAEPRRLGADPRELEAVSCDRLRG